MPNPAPFAFDVAREGRTTRVALEGELDLATAPALDEKLRELVAGDGSELILDLRGLTFMDSTGLRILVQADAAAKRDGVALQIIRGPKAIDRLLALSGLDELLPLVEAPSDAA